MEKSEQPPPYTSGAGPSPPGAPPKYGFAPPDQGPAPLQQPQQLPAMQAQPAVIMTTAVPFGPHSIRLNCPHCRADVDTMTEKSPSIMAWISAGALCFLGLFCGCCLIPICMDSCQATEHSCPSCKRFIGKYSQY